MLLSESPVEKKRSLSRKEIFRIFLKTGRKRVAFSILCGILIFLALTSLIMVVYTHRYNMFLQYESENIDWFNDGQISAKSNRIKTGTFNYSLSYLDQLVDDFINMTTEIVPNIRITDYSAALSAEVYTYEPSIPVEPWLNHEIMTFDNKTYLALNSSLVEGRLPMNSSELLYYRGNINTTALNQIIELYTITDTGTEYRNYTVVGIVENIEEAFLNASVSNDLVGWSFENIMFYNYQRTNLFFTNYNLFVNWSNSLDYFFGVITHLTDFKYDNSAIKLNNLYQIIQNIPKENELTASTVLQYMVNIAPDLKNFYLDFSELWVQETTKILYINAPLILIIGLLSIVTLNIGSKDLGVNFRRMKIYGISYNTIRGMVLLENLIFTLVSFIAGTSLGFLTSYLFTLNIPNKPGNFYLYFIQEPLLLICWGLFLFGFFALSYVLQNSIAKKTAKTAPEEYQKKRVRFKGIFSTNEFRLFVLALIFTVISLSLYLVYTYTGPETTIRSNISFLTFFWFMITCSAAFILTFVFLLIARLVTLFWDFIGEKIWSRNLNLYSLSIKHLSVNSTIFQIAILGALIFGFVILPGIAMDQSLPNHVESETEFMMGGGSIVVFDWVDPEDERDVLLDGIAEIKNYTELTQYSIINTNEDERYEKAFRISMTGLENPEVFADLIDNSMLTRNGLSLEDIRNLKYKMNMLMDAKFARKNRLSYLENFSTLKYSRYEKNLTYLNSFKIFPGTTLPKKNVFDTSTEVFSIVAGRHTVREVTRALHYTTEVYTQSLKILIPQNDTVIPEIKQKLSDLNITASSFDEVYDDIYSGISLFPKNNLIFFAFLSSFTLIFIGYFTGMKIFEERVRIIESLFRAGAVRSQILGIFTFELAIINSIPLLIMLLATLPIIRIVAVNFLSVQEIYFQYQHGIAWWTIILVFIGGIALSIIGWLLALIPAIYRYKPVKQE